MLFQILEKIFTCQWGCLQRVRRYAYFLFMVFLTEFAWDGWCFELSTTAAIELTIYYRFFHIKFAFLEEDHGGSLFSHSLKRFQRYFKYLNPNDFPWFYYKWFYYENLPYWMFDGVCRWYRKILQNATLGHICHHLWELIPQIISICKGQQFVIYPRIHILGGFWQNKKVVFIIIFCS